LIEAPVLLVGRRGFHVAMLADGLERAYNIIIAEFFIALL
jgi:hypothetical protein